MPNKFETYVNYMHKIKSNRVKCLNFLFYNYDLDFFLLFLSVLRVLLSSTRSSSFRKDSMETRSMLVQYKLVLNLTTESRKSLTFPSKVPRESREKDVCRPRYFCRIAHSFCIGLTSRLRVKTSSMLIQFESVFNSISGSGGAFDFPSRTVEREKCRRVQFLHFFIILIAHFRSTSFF